jgi:hypothetical protein
MSPRGGTFTGFVEIIVTAEAPMVISLNDAEPVCGSSSVTSDILTLLSSTTVQARACSETSQSDVFSASFEVLPAPVSRVSFTMEGITPDEINQDVIDHFAEALAKELGISKYRIVNVNIDARRRLLDVSMSFDLIASSAADAQLLSAMVCRNRHTLAPIMI